MVQQVTTGTLATKKLPKVYLKLPPEPRYSPISDLPDTQSAPIDLNELTRYICDIVLQCKNIAGFLVDILLQCKNIA